MLFGITLCDLVLLPSYMYICVYLDENSLKKTYSIARYVCTHATQNDEEMMENDEVRFPATTFFRSFLYSSLLKDQTNSHRFLKEH